MELPQHQVQRIFEAEGRKPTHDFLSLCTHANMQLQDPIRSPSSQGYLKTHDFLQPLERVGKTTAKEDRAADTSSLERPPPPPSVEHILPGGIGTYSINHISSYFNQRVPKPEGDQIFSASSTEKNEEHSNCSSYTGSGFTLWEESAMKKGKTGKENVVEKSNVVRDAATEVGQWTKPERPSQSSTNNHHNSFSSLSSSLPSGQKSQSFMEMIKSGRDNTQDDNLEEEEDFVLKKETPSPIHKGELRVKVDGISTDQKANTPRSKHSATEQRRRSKINDRFQMLRELIPHGDQKRDKASFLLEVIEYIQFLQQKVHRYEGSYQGWNREPAKLVPWRNGKRTAENHPDQPQGTSSGAGPGLLFAAKLEENSINLSPNIPGSSQNPAESDVNSATTFKVDHYPAAVYKGMPFPLSLQSNFLNWSRSAAVAQLPPRLISDGDNVTTQSQLQPNQSISCTTDAAVAGDKLKEQELTVEGGTINISSVYSQGLLNTLTQALQSSGVDLSQASISVQIDIGKRASTRTEVPTSTTKGNEVHCSNEEAKRPRASGGEESDTLIKKFKRSKS